ncbi:MAG: S1 RNA-binding domain-containing protein [Mariniblastus sp.]|nr:S1 RNA-binding domain-containing protein [Mariniblastus sp.]
MSSQPNNQNPQSTAPSTDQAAVESAPPTQEQPTPQAPVSVETPATAEPTTEPPVAETKETTVPESTETKVEEPPSPPPASKIAIGSQRDTADKSLVPSQPKAVQAAVANPITLGKKEETITVPLADIKSDVGFSDDVDAEIEAALGDISMDDVVEKTEASENEIEPNTRVKAAVTKIHEDNVFFKLAGQYEGVAALHHFTEAPKEGDLVEIIVRSLNKEDGLYELAVPGASVGISDWEDIIEGAVVDARVTGSNTGGLEVTVNSIRGFIPASQIDRFRVEDFSAYVNQKFPCVVVEVNPDKRKLVLSRRAILDRENEEKRKQLLKELEAGQLREGTVTKLMDFGAFVDLGGIEGLIHISKISWSRVKHPSEVLSVGEAVKVKVEKIDLESNRISLSHRDTLEHPWKNVSNQFVADMVVKGTVTRIADFGAFVKIAPGIEGLVHISELAYQRVAKVSNVVSEGQEIEVKILSVDPDSQKISLSHKACLAPPAPKKSAPGKEKAPEVEEPPRELAVKAGSEPLKGGRDRKSGGESIGLKW